MENKKGGFNSNFGFLMATIGSAVGLGNLWGFPYKLGSNGGFLFLIFYLILAVFVGYPCMLAEITIGRKTQKGVLSAYKAVDKRFTFNGWIEFLAPLFLICFYVVFGGYAIRYVIANIGSLFNAGFGINDTDSGAFFDGFVQSGAPAVIYTLIFLALTLLIIMGGVSSSIEKVSKFCMPALTIMLVIVCIRAITMPGGVEGLKFIFKPSAEAIEETGILKVLGIAGNQMFFSLSLASGSCIAFGSYLGKKENLERNAIIVPVADTIIAILAAMTVMPAVFASGLEPGAGPGLLFVSLQTVFQSMPAGDVFGVIFYLLVFFAAITSSVSMLEGPTSVLLDNQAEAGKEMNRKKMTLCIGIIPLIGGTLVAIDALGARGLWHPFGLGTWLDTFDLFAEGLLMPAGAIFMAIMLGWCRKGYLDDEIESSGEYKTKGFCNFCFKWVIPIVIAFVLLVTLNTFFGFTDVI